MNWDPFQREVLAELGHVLYRQAGAAMAIDAGSERIEAPHPDALASGDRMLANLAHAAGMSAEALHACFGDVQPIAGLRGNAAAKRALWPRLRALRSQRG